MQRSCRSRRWREVRPGKKAALLSAPSLAEKWYGASAADNVDGVLCEEEEGAMVVVINVFVGEENIIGACAKRGWERRRMGGRLVLLGAGREIGEVCACIEKTSAGGPCDASSVVDISGGRE